MGHIHSLLAIRKLAVAQNLGNFLQLTTLHLFQKQERGLIVTSRTKICLATDKRFTERERQNRTNE